MYEGELKPKDQAALTNLKGRLVDMLDYDPRKIGSDFFLFQWLRAHGMNVEKTEQTVRNAFKWRKDNDIVEAYGNLPEDLLQQFPIDAECFTKKGIRVYTLTVRDWNVREALDQGDEEKLRRYIFLQSMKAETAWLDFNEKSLQQNGMCVMYHPQNIHFIINAKNCPIEQFLSPKVIESFIGTFSCMARYFNGKGTELIFINFTTLYYVLFNAIRPLLTFTADMQFYSCNSDKWKKFLFEFIDPDQLTKQFGGTKLSIGE